MRQGATLEELAVGADGVKVRCAGDVTIEARHLVAADGHWSTVRRQLHPDEPRDLGTWHAARQYFDGVDDERLWVLFEEDLLPGYAWVFPMPGGGANVGFGVLRDGRHGRELKELWADVLARPRLRAILGRNAHARDTVRAWPIPTAYSPPRLADGPVLYAGDAAAVVDPLTGEGIAQALETGVAAADAIAGGGDADAVARRYRDTVDRALGRDLRFAHRLQRILAYTARCARVDQGRRLVRLDPPQLRPVALRGVSARGGVHPGPVAPAAFHSTGRVLPDSRRLVDPARGTRTTREHDMADGKTEVTIAKPPEEVWALVGQFGGLDEWMPGIEKCEVDGDIRTIETMGMEIQEQLKGRDDATRTISYSIVKAPISLEHHLATISVAESGDGSILTWAWEIRPDDMAGAFGPVYEGSAQAVKQHFEG